MSQFEKLWEFADAAAVPDNTSATLGYIDITTSYFTDWLNSGVDLWVVITCNTVASAGTSITGKLCIHTAVDVHSGTALMTGRTIARTALSANPKAAAQMIFACPLSAALAGLTHAAILAATWRYFGPTLTTVGTLTACLVDSYLRVGKPEFPTVQINASNI